MQVIDVIGREHVDLSSKQLEELVGMLTKEELVEDKSKYGMYPKQYCFCASCTLFCYAFDK